MSKDYQNIKNRNLLIETWIALRRFPEDSDDYNSRLWAEFDLAELARIEPQACWEIILEILNKDCEPGAMANLAAGALEDLLVSNGPEFIDRIEKEAESNGVFRILLGGVWQNDIKLDIWKRIEALVSKKW